MAPLYIRWDARRPGRAHRSRNHVTGAPEAGLSVVDVKGNRLGDLARAVGEYGRMYLAHGARCWLVTGREVGRGSDGEPLLRRVRVVREITGAELDRLMEIAGRLNDVTIARNLVRRLLHEIRRRDIPRYAPITAAELRWALAEVRQGRW